MIWNDMDKFNLKRHVSLHHHLHHQSFLPIDINRQAPKSERARNNIRIVLYSHDTMGLGHIRRNLLIAQILSSSSLRPDILLACGAQEAGMYAMPEGVDCLILPSLFKHADGSYCARRLRMELSELIELRAHILLSAISAFHPHVFIVDNIVLGAEGELEHTLAYLKSASHTRCVLGMRDIFDDPAAVINDPDMQKKIYAFRNYYDEIWVYGDPLVYDPLKEYQFPLDVAAMARYTGYLDQSVRLQFHDHKKTETFMKGLGLEETPFVLCSVGGGQDGDRLVSAFAKAELPQQLKGVVLTGPHMNAEVKQRLNRQAECNDRLIILDFVSEPASLLQHAACVIAMGGYNTITEILSFGKRALIVPRVTPRTEQLIRGQRLRDLGFLDLLHPDELTARALSIWLRRAVPAQQYTVKGRIDIGGGSRLDELISHLVSQRYQVTDRTRGTFPKNLPELTSDFQDEENRYGG